MLLQPLYTLKQSGLHFQNKQRSAYKSFASNEHGLNICFSILLYIFIRGRTFAIAHTKAKPFTFAVIVFGQAAG